MNVTGAETAVETRKAIRLRKNNPHTTPHPASGRHEDRVAQDMVRGPRDSADTHDDTPTALSGKEVTF